MKWNGRVRDASRIKGWLTPLRVHCCLSWSYHIWIRPSWPASQETDGVFIVSKLAVQTFMCVCVPLVVYPCKFCACLPGQYPRSEICVWCLVGKEQREHAEHHMTFTSWDRDGKTEREWQRDGQRRVINFSLGSSCTVLLGFFLSVCLFVSDTLKHTH